MILSLDFETRSTVELKKTGVYPYAAHPDTGVWCLAWAIDDEHPQIWVPEDGELPVDITEAIKAGAELRAWNVNFERNIWNQLCVPRFGFPHVELDQWYDTAADAAAMSLPRSLGQCARVLKVYEQKDDAGHRLMLRMARPRSTKGGIVWWDAPDRRRMLEEYCRQDVRAERSIYQAILRLSKRERQIFLLDQRINDRGIFVDVPLIKSAKKIVRHGLDDANDAIRVATNGDVTGVSKVADLKKWLWAQGYEVDSVNKNVIRELLEGDNPDPVRMALEARAAAGRSSVAKLDSMLAARGKDDRIRGVMLYHGADTGRWAGRLVQPHNFPRPTVDDIEAFIPLVEQRDYEGIDMIYPPLMVVSSMLRSMLRAAPGNVLMCADYAQIEARVTAWIAGEAELLAEFSKPSPKVYEKMAAKIYGKESEDIAKDSDERQLGKAVVLGCGFGMGGEKFQKTAAEQYGLFLTEPFARDVVRIFRSTFHEIVQSWYDLNRAAVQAVSKPGIVVEARKCKFAVRKTYLFIKLPSGRALCYSAPRIVQRETPWGTEYAAVEVNYINSQTRKWGPRTFYGGLLMENIVQATARDIMADAMLRVDDEFPVILSVHDEVVSEVQGGTKRLQDFLDLMEATPEWARGCPIAVEGWVGERYRK